MLEEAFRSDDNYKKSVNRPLEGVPIALKDNIDIVLNNGGVPVTAGTSVLLNHKPNFEGTLWHWRLKNQGAIYSGKTIMAELGLGTATKNNFFGTPRSPYNTDLTSGGSSGGSGGSVGSGIVPVALGTDTTGGIRIPAACNGTVGYRPTINRWPADFGLKLSPTLDSIGPLTASVRDASLLDEIVTGERMLSFFDISSVRIGLP